MLLALPFFFLFFSSSLLPLSPLLFSLPPSFSLFSPFHFSSLVHFPSPLPSHHSLHLSSCPLCLQTTGHKRAPLLFGRRLSQCPDRSQTHLRGYGWEHTVQVHQHQSNKTRADSCGSDGPLRENLRHPGVQFASISQARSAVWRPQLSGALCSRSHLKLSLREDKKTQHSGHYLSLV